MITDSKKGEGQYYNAYEKDIAVVNIFFGSSTVFGLESSTYFEQFKTPHVKFKNGHILPTGQWYAPSAVQSVILCYTLLYSALLCFTLLYTA